MYQAPYHIADYAEHPEWHKTVVTWLHYEWLRNAPDNIKPEEVGRMLQERLQSMHSHAHSQSIPSTFLAHDTQRPLGSVSLIRYPLSREPNRTWLTNLFVDYPFQRQGIGQSLLQHVEDFARQKCLQELSLYTFDAKDYYLQKGWSWLSSGEVNGKSVDIFVKSL